MHRVVARVVRGRLTGCGPAQGVTSAGGTTPWAESLEEVVSAMP
jgi:hypothetical protein